MNDLALIEIPNHLIVFSTPKGLDAIIDKIQAEKDAEAAAQRERDKIAAEKKVEADALAKREADKEHRRKINGEAEAAIMKVAAILDAEERATAIVTAIAQGKIPHITIGY